MDQFVGVTDISDRFKWILFLEGVGKHLSCEENVLVSRPGTSLLHASERSLQLVANMFSVIVLDECQDTNADQQVEEARRGLLDRQHARVRQAHQRRGVVRTAVQQHARFALVAIIDTLPERLRVHAAAVILD